jgi:hypothetical protein
VRTLVPFKACIVLFPLIKGAVHQLVEIAGGNESKDLIFRDFRCGLREGEKHSNNFGHGNCVLGRFIRVHVSE